MLVPRNHAPKIHQNPQDNELSSSESLPPLHLNHILHSVFNSLLISRITLLLLPSQFVSNTPFERSVESPSDPLSDPSPTNIYDNMFQSSSTHRARLAHLSQYLSAMAKPESVFAITRGHMYPWFAREFQPGDLILFTKHDANPDAQYHQSYRQCEDCQDCKNDIILPILLWSTAGFMIISLNIGLTIMGLQLRGICWVWCLLLFAAYLLILRLMWPARKRWMEFCGLKWHFHFIHRICQLISLYQLTRNTEERQWHWCHSSKNSLGPIKRRQTYLDDGWIVVRLEPWPATFTSPWLEWLNWVPSLIQDARRYSISAYLYKNMSREIIAAPMQCSVTGLERVARIQAKQKGISFAEINPAEHRWPMRDLKGRFTLK